MEKMIKETGANADGIEDAQCRICLVQAILQLAVVKTGAH
jgi:hypothetical protein